MIFITKLNDNLYTTQAFVGGKKVCESKISADAENVWTISAWYTVKDQHKRGYGKKTLLENLRVMRELLGRPTGVRYVWNGANQYVMDWLNKNFQPTTLLPIAELKYQEEDCWEAHVYELNTDNVMRFIDGASKKQGSVI